MNEVSHSLDRLAMATERLLTTATALSDAQVREPSSLPGWTRGHVLTHIARNADGLGNLLIWARTGTETPMYPSARSRGDDIEAGACPDQQVAEPIGVAGDVGQHVPAGPARQ